MLQPYYQFCTKISKSRRERYITSVTFVEKGCSFACLVPLKKKLSTGRGFSPGMQALISGFSIA